VRQRALAALLGALTVALIAPAAGILPVTPTRAAATDLTLVTDAVYTVEPDHNRVRISMSIVARNHLTETRTRRHYFDHASLAVQPGTSGFRLTGAPGASVRVVARRAKYTLLRINFGSRLYDGKSRTFRLTFSQVDRGRVVDRDLRIGPGFVTLPVWAYGSTGARGSTVRVRFPAGYDVTVESGKFASNTRTASGGTELASGPIAAPLTWFAYVSAQSDPVYAETSLNIDVGQQSVPLTIRAWANDAGWARRTRTLFEQALPSLAADIGIDWPTGEPTVVQEAANRSKDAYAGRYDPAQRTIELAYWADPLVAVRQAAHGWFNGSLLADRWASEGFASLYAERTAAALGLDGSAGTSASGDIASTGDTSGTGAVAAETSPSEVADALKADVLPLNAWADPPDPPDRTTEAYGLAASEALAAAIRERAGDDALRRVWADIAAGVGAYQPPDGTASEPEGVAGAPDWRGLLDLLEAETGKDFTDLWRTWVLRADELPLLEERAAARLEYQQTLAVAGDWALPRRIRDAMRAWQFDTARQLLADARNVIAEHHAVQQLAASEGLTIPTTMRQPFEAGLFSDAAQRAQDDRNAILAIVQAEHARDDATDALTQIGMLGENPEADLANARLGLAAGNLDQTLGAADAAYRAWADAWQEGRRRALLAVAALATALVLGSTIFERARRARRRSSAPYTQAHR
jgi:hypothetical protein